MKRRSEGGTGAQVGLHRAAAEGFTADVSRLIAEGADVDARDSTLRTPLHAACQQEQLEVVKILLAAGALVDPRDSFGNTPLWRAVFAFQGGDPTLIRLLLDAGADPDCKNDSNRSPRDMALTFERPGIRTVFP